MEKDRIKALTAPFAAFDMDGTLLDSNGAFVDVSDAYLRQRGAVLDDGFIERAKTMNFTQYCGALRERANSAESAEETMTEITERIRSFYASEAQLKPGAKAYLEKLKRRGVRMCVASATEEPLIRVVLERFGLEGYFEFIVTVTQVGADKSQPDIFLEAARRFGESELSRVTLYDDAFEALQSASNAGLRTVGLFDPVCANTEEAARQLCDAYAESFEELLQY